jgi:hypothetical protein
MNFRNLPSRLKRLEGNVGPDRCPASGQPTDRSGMVEFIEFRLHDDPTVYPDPPPVPESELCPACRLPTRVQIIERFPPEPAGATGEEV